MMYLEKDLDLNKDIVFRHRRQNKPMNKEYIKKRRNKNEKSNEFK